MIRVLNSAIQHASGLAGPRFQHFSLSSDGAAHTHEAKSIERELLISNGGRSLHTLADMLTSGGRKAGAC
jgi:hypothetical protein